MDSTIFSGSSRYSSDFKSVIDRSVGIASLGLNQLNNQRGALSAQQAELGGISAKFTALQSALTNLGTQAKGTSVTASLTNGSLIRTSVADSALAGDYSLKILDLGSAATTISNDSLSKVVDPAKDSISTATTLHLTVDGTDYDIEPADRSLNGLVAAINSATKGAVRATAVNVGGSQPDYRLSLQSTKLGSVAISLDDGSPLLDTLSAGSPVRYQVNGRTTDVLSDSRTIQLAPGLKIDLLGTGDAGVSLNRSSARLTDAVQNVVSAYNAAAGSLDAQRGAKAGSLFGQGIIGTLSGALRQIGGFNSGQGGIGSVAEIGLQFDESGALALDAAKFQQVVTDRFSDLQDLLGNRFATQATSVMSSILDAQNGSLTSAVSSLGQSITNQDGRIGLEQDKIDHLRESLNAQLAKSDALIASMEQQVRYMTSLFEAMSASRNQ